MRVLCGGGVIGASIAYFLSLRQVEAIVVERASVACAASGKSGGFLALDWCDATPLGPLARRSFELHGELASVFEGGWGYRRLDTLSVLASARRNLGSSRNSDLPNWLAPDALVNGQLGTTETTAQVHPAGFTKGTMDAAIDRGARLRMGCVTGVAFGSDDGRVTGVFVDGELVVGDAVVMLSSPGVAPPWPGDVPGEPLAPRPTGDAVFNYPSSLLFAPAVTVPLMAIGGLPFGVQVMGQPQQDAWVTSIARWLAENVAPVVAD